jgi:hypothetical protein
MRALSTIAGLIIVCGIDFSVARQSTATATQQISAAASAQPADAQKVRAEISAVENVTISGRRRASTIDTAPPTECPTM